MTRAEPAPRSAAPHVEAVGATNLQDVIDDAKSLADLLSRCEFRNSNNWRWTLGEEGARHIAGAVAAWNKRATPPGAVTLSAEQVREIADGVVQRICEFDDRTSPEDQPEMMLVTGQELHAIIHEQIAALAPILKGDEL